MIEEEEKAQEDGTLTMNYDAAVRPYVDLVDQLRSLGIDKDIEVPQIAVMGDQSSGKSSVLESLCGVPFPRGSGLVTRCATQIRMKKMTPGTPWEARIALSWSKDQPEESGVVKDRSELGTKISQLTTHLLKESATDFSSDIIVIDILSSDVPDLTVVDLPGIVRTTIEGQSKSVINDVNHLIDSYLKQSRTIILAVIPANVDIATVDILEKATVVDPTGDRTLGVFTKPDLVDAGTEKEIVAVLTNQLKPLKNGYNMLRNRNNQELKYDIPIAEAHRTEKLYFKEHHIYGQLSEEYFGIQNLTDKLTSILVTRIHHHLPSMKEELTHFLHETSEALVAMGPPAPTNIMVQFRDYDRMCEGFAELYSNALIGYYADPVFISDNSLQLCAIAKAEFAVLKQNLLATQPAFNDDTFIEDLKQEINLCRGRELPGFLSVNVFKKLMSSYIAKWKEPSLQCLEKCKDECLRVCEKLLHVKLLAQYPSLRSFVFDKVIKCILDATHKAKCEIEQAVEREIDEPFTQNHYYMDTVNKIRGEQFLQGLTLHLKPLYQRFLISSHKSNHHEEQSGILLEKDALAQNIKTWYMDGIGNASNESQEANDMNIVLQSYWKVAWKRYADYTPQVIQKSLLDSIRDQLSAVLQCHVPEEIKSFFKVPKDLQKKRLQLDEKEVRLKKAVKMLQSLSLTSY